MITKSTHLSSSIGLDATASMLPKTLADVVTENPSGKLAEVVTENPSGKLAEVVTENPSGNLGICGDGTTTNISEILRTS